MGAEIKGLRVISKIAKKSCVLKLHKYLKNVTYSSSFLELQGIQIKTGIGDTNQSSQGTLHLWIDFYKHSVSDQFKLPPH